MQRYQGFQRPNRQVDVKSGQELNDYSLLCPINYLTGILVLLIPRKVLFPDQQFSPSILLAAFDIYLSPKTSRVRVALYSKSNQPK